MNRTLKTVCAVLLSLLHSAVHAQLEDKSVNPGINNSYLQDKIDVTQWVERFESEGREVYNNRQAIIGHCEIKPGMAIADIGSSTGLFTELLAQATGDQGKVYAVDIVPAFLAKIRGRMQEKNIHHVETILCSDRSVKLPENSIDLAYICDVYHHFEYPKSSMTSLYIALKPGGKVVLVEFVREQGVSSDWILSHVRAGKETFSKEITDCGFEFLSEVDGLLKENYIRIFQVPMNKKSHSGN